MFFLVIKVSLSYFPFNRGQMRVLDTNLAIYHPHLLLFPIHYAFISNGGPFQAEPCIIRFPQSWKTWEKSENLKVISMLENGMDI